MQKKYLLLFPKSNVIAKIYSGNYLSYKSNFIRANATNTENTILLKEQTDYYI